MTYSYVLRYIEGAASISPSRERMSLLCEKLGSPQKKLRFVLVGGDFGKTSVATCIGNILSEAGYVTGLYTSPQVTDVRDRISVNGGRMSHGEFTELARSFKRGVSSLVADLKDSGNMFYDDMNPSSEEILLAMALMHFENTRCDIAVIECDSAGMRGIIDVLGTPLVSVVSGIQQNKKDRLNTDLFQDKHNGFELSDVIKRGTREVVCNVSGAVQYKLVSDYCAAINCRLSIPAYSDVSVGSVRPVGTEINYRNTLYSVNTMSRGLIDDVLTSVEVAHALRRTGVVLPGTAIQRGVSSVNFRLCFDILSVSPTIVVDRADSREAVIAMCRAIVDNKLGDGGEIRAYTNSDNTDMLKEIRSELGTDVKVFIAETPDRKTLKSIIEYSTGITVIFGSAEYAAGFASELRRTLAGF